MKVNEIATLTGVTVRTLHYYDEIGLLPPSSFSGAGYRLYTNSDLARLQEILFFRELDFSLHEIKQILTAPGYDRVEALRRQHQLLVAQKNRLERLIQLTEQSMKGDTTMSFTEFDMSEINAHKKQYAEEVQQRWGASEAYAESQKKTGKYTADQWQSIQGEMATLFDGFAALRGTDPAAPAAASLVAQWQGCISKHFYSCTNEILAGLGQMYAGDDRFAKNIDKHGQGTAQFMSDAIAAYCAKEQ